MIDDIFSSIFHAALIECGWGEFSEQLYFETPKNEEHGDISTNIAMLLAKPLRLSPRIIAEKLIDAIKSSNSRYIENIGVAGAGFINIFWSQDCYAELLEKIFLAGIDYGRLNVGENKTANIEFVSANPTGLLHLGHGRNACIGDAVANIFSWGGYTVAREYYFNNAGNQMNQLALSIHARYCQLFDESYPFLSDGYHGEYIKEIANNLQAEFGDALLEASTENIAKCKEAGEHYCISSIRNTLKRLDIRHDNYFNELSLYEDKSVENTILSLRERNLAYDKEDAVWIALSAIDNKLEDRVIVKSTGEPTYRLPDIAYHINKLNRGFDIVLDVLGADHIAAVPDVIAAVKALGHDEKKIKVLLYQFVTLTENGEQVKMSKRTGKSYTLDDLIDDVGVDVVKFFFLMRGINTHLEFDLALARERSEKNPVFYLQYAHARISKILNASAASEYSTADSRIFSLLQTAPERNAIKIISRFPEFLLRALNAAEPQIIADYLKILAAHFHSFYHECRILQAETPELRIARLALCATTKHTLANGLAILGLSAPESM